MPSQQSPTRSIGEGSSTSITATTAVNYSLKRERSYTMNEGSEEPHGDADMMEDGDGHRDKVRLTDSRPICTSCEQCQIRKGKCDRGQPVCGWCLANDKVCEYKERKKPGLRAGYGRNLERRLDQVEEKLEAQARVIEILSRTRNGLEVNTAIANSSNPTMASPATASDHRALPANGQVPVPFGPKRPRTLSNAFPPPPPTWPTSPRDSMHGSNEHRAEHVPPPSAGYGAAAPEATEARKGAAHDPDLPPTDLLYNLLDLYFVHINQWFPLLERRSTMEKLFGSSGWEETDIILMHAIAATTLRFSNDPRLNDTNREEYHVRSKQKVLLYGMEHCSVEALQALIIVALNFTGSRNGGAGLNLLALIARSAIQLGLAKEAYSSPVLPAYMSNSTLGISMLPPPQDFIEDESRRRLFWLVYILDRDATVATSFDFTVQESDIDRKLPCKDELFVLNKAVETKWFQTQDRSGYSVNDPGTLGSLSYLVELKGLLTKIHQFLKRPVDIGNLQDVEKWQHTYRSLDASLRDWRLNLPAEFRNIERVLNPSQSARPVSPSWIMLQATYYTVSIRLHSAAAYPPHKSQIFSPSYSASQRCFQETESIISLAKYVIANRTLLSYGPPFAFSLWVGARVLLVHGSSVEKHVNPSVHFLIDTLRQLGAAWPIAARYSDILARVMDDYQAGITSGNAAGASSTSTGVGGGSTLANGTTAGASGPASSTVPILADMRRCAYDLDILISSSSSRSRSAQPMHDMRNGGLPPASSLPHVPALLHHHSSSGINAQKVPEPNELEYLEAFDFFNYPRLPIPQPPLDANGNINPNANLGAANGGQVKRGAEQEGYVNIDHFSVNRDADWLSQQQMT